MPHPLRSFSPSPPAAGLLGVAFATLALLLSAKPAQAQNFWEETFSDEVYSAGATIITGDTPWLVTSGPSSQAPEIIDVDGNLVAELDESRSTVTVRSLSGNFSPAGGSNVYFGLTARFRDAPEGGAVFARFNRSSSLGLLWARAVGDQVQLGVSTQSEDPEEVSWVPFRNRRVNYNQPTRLMIGIESQAGEWRARLWVGPVSSSAEQQATAQDTSVRVASEVALVQQDGIGTVEVDDITASTSFASARLTSQSNPVILEGHSRFRSETAQSVNNALVGEYGANVSSGLDDEITGMHWTLDSHEGDLSRVRRVAFYWESDTPQEGIFDGVPVNFLRAPTTTDTQLAELNDPFESDQFNSGLQTTSFGEQPPIDSGVDTRLYVVIDLEDAPVGASYTFTLHGITTGDNLPYHGSPLLGYNLHVQEGGGEGVLLSEIKAYPPGGNASFEYIEIRGPANQQLTNVYLFGVLSATEHGYRRGVIDFVIDLSEHHLGSNGMMLVVPQAGLYSFPSETSIVVDNNLQIGGGARTIWLGLSTKIPRMNANDGDGLIWIDTTNDGTPNQMPLGVTLLDSVAYTDEGAEDLAYGPDLRLAHGLPAAPHAMVRLPGERSANSANAWYSGMLTGDPAESEFTEPLSNNFPNNGALRPGETLDPPPGASGSGGSSSNGGCGAMPRAAVVPSLAGLSALLLLVLALGVVRRRGA